MVFSGLSEDVWEPALLTGVTVDGVEDQASKLVFDVTPLTGPALGWEGLFR